jgi:hypothetical protein
MALATATLTFTSGGATSQTFTWTPLVPNLPLTAATPKVLSCSVVVTGAGQGDVGAFLSSAPTSSGGTCELTAATDCTVYLVASD